MRLLTGTLSALILGAALWVGTFSLRGAPPIGAFLNPAHGVWALGQHGELRGEQSVQLAGLGAEAEVRYDDRGVPHIFAASELDAYRALGWVHARDRLFQMELTQRSVAGTLTELVGARALPRDREARRQGLARSADAKWAAIPADAGSRRGVEAYMEGLNAYIRGMGPADLPLEYRLLQKTPREFEPRDTYYLLAAMSLTLAWSDDELRRGAIESLIGKAAAAALFPVDAPIQEPIEPVPGRTAPRIADQRLPAPQLASAQAVREAERWLATRELVSAGMPRDAHGALLTRGEGVVGSNNWAVAPGRTEAGYALLSGDPHLELTLPSIWYEVHLVVPGELDVYGVSLPLSPIVPIGFNRDVAWTATNTGADVMDFYRETVDDTTNPARYQVDGAWRDLTTHVEEFRDADGTAVAVDTLRTTHRGPLWSTPLGWLSMRWTALEISDEGEAFRAASRATTVDEWYAAMRDYKAPAQNFLVADRGGQIGIRSTGRYPLRPGDGRGDKVFDGSTSASDWTGDWSLERVPRSVNPAQGFLASANQQPLDPAVRPGYLGWNWPPPWRAIRINAILRGDSAMTPEKMRLAHTDPHSALTPVLLVALREAAEDARDADALSTTDGEALAVFDAWDQRFDTESRGAVLFEAFLAAVTRRTWDELLLPGENRRVGTPNSMIMARLLADPTSVWWDDRRTEEMTEDRDDILMEALRDAWRETRARHGDDPAAWRWGAVRRANVRHLLQLPGLGREELSVQSGPGTLAPADGGGTHGASWRFVVELGPELRAWGTYPGGQSGNPVSTRYADRIPQWQRGELSPLRIPRTPAEVADSALASTLTFRPE